MSVNHNYCQASSVCAYTCLCVWCSGVCVCVCVCVRMCVCWELGVDLTFLMTGLSITLPLSFFHRACMFSICFDQCIQQQISNKLWCVHGTFTQATASCGTANTMTGLSACGFQVLEKQSSNNAEVKRSKADRALGITGLVQDWTCQLSGSTL